MHCDARACHWLGRNGGKPGCGIRTSAMSPRQRRANFVGMAASPDAGLEPPGKPPVAWAARVGMAASPDAGLELWCRRRWACRAAWVGMAASPDAGLELHLRGKELQGQDPS